VAEFKAFPKIARLTNLTMVITEKIDGTNACVVVTEEGEVLAQSRKRFVTPGDDNYGFAKWVKENEEDLRGLGEGYHYGEWWGKGIQRSYGMTERRFSLFNVGRWAKREIEIEDGFSKELAPECCHVVPTLSYSTPFDMDIIDSTAYYLTEFGSEAVMDYMNPEGLMIYIPELHKYVKHLFKAGPKGEG